MLRCILPFYGFLIKGDEIKGLVHEFMSQGSLSNYVSKYKNEKNPFFTFTSVLRIYRGIHHLKSNSLIHRDSNPANILIDHDNTLYISDFEAVKQTKGDEKEEETTFSFNTNNSNAISNLGILYLNGLGVDQDLNKEKELFEFSAKLNNSTAFAILGKVYFEVLIVEQDINKAKEYFK